MPTIGVYQAKTQFSKLIERVIRGERITITRHGVPVAVLTPVSPAASRPVEDVINDLKAFRQGH
jgi:prevent-host-death family protein